MCEPRVYDAREFSSDGFHPSDSGYALMAELGLPGAEKRHGRDALRALSHSARCCPCSRPADKGNGGFAREKLPTRWQGRST